MSNNYHDPYNPSNNIHPESDFEAEPNIIHRARKYMATMDSAVAGDEGHTATIKVACALARVFALVFDDVLKLLIEYNQRCDPPWILEDLRHKAAEADRLVDSTNNRDMLGSTRTSTTPYLGGFNEFGPGDISWLARSRNIPEGGIKLASERGFLRSGNWHGLECYALSDVSGNLIELRRLNGELFPAVPQYNLGERKCHTMEARKDGQLESSNPKRLNLLLLSRADRIFCTPTFGLSKRVCRNESPWLACYHRPPTSSTIHSNCLGENLFAFFHTWMRLA